MFGKRSSNTNTTVIGQGSRFIGTLELEGAAHIEGQCEGTIRAGSQLSVGSHGTVSGELQGRVVVIAGRVEGTVMADETLHVLKNGSVLGDVYYGKLQVDSGGVIDGSSHQGPRPESAAHNGAEQARFDDSGLIDARAKLSSVRPAAAEVRRSNAPGAR